MKSILAAYMLGNFEIQSCGEKQIIICKDGSYSLAS